MRLITALALTIATIRCGDTIVNVPTANSAVPVASSPVPTPAQRTTIEFRATGNASSARIRYSAPSDGLTQVVSSLPYANNFTTTETSLFLSLEVTPLAYSVITNPFLSIQIVAGGKVFREATQNDLTANTLAVSGTWRQ